MAGYKGLKAGWSSIKSDVEEKCGSRIDYRPNLRVEVWDVEGERWAWYWIDGVSGVTPVTVVQTSTERVVLKDRRLQKRDVVGIVDRMSGLEERMWGGNFDFESKDVASTCKRFN
jgi:hypothetical protein